MEIKKIILFALLVAIIVFSSTAIIINNFNNRGNELNVGSAPFRPSGISVSIRQDLVAGASRSDTTLNIDPIITADGNRWTMTQAGGILYGKIDQGNTNEEIISWTGMTDNTTYYTLTGLEWGYDYTGNTTSTANMKRHNSGAKLIITDDDHYLNTVYMNLGYDQTVTGIKTFSTYPVIDSSTGVATTTWQLVTLGQLASVTAQGAATSTETYGGIVRLGTQTETASSTNNGANDPTVVQTQYVTSTPSALRGLYIPMAENDGYLSQSWFDLTETWSFSDFLVTSGTVGTLTVTGNLSNQGSITSSVSIDSPQYCINGGGCITDFNYSKRIYTSNTEVLLRNNATETTLYSFTLPANYLGTGNAVKITIPVNDFDYEGSSGGGSGIIFRLKYDNTTIASAATGNGSDGSTTNFRGSIDAMLVASSTTALQKGFIKFQALGSTITDNSPALNGAFAFDDLSEGESCAEDSTTDLTVYVTAQWGAADNDSLLKVNGIVAELIRN